MDDDTCVDYGNTAIYGSFKATDTSRLHAERKPDIKENSGNLVIYLCDI